MLYIRGTRHNSNIALLSMLVLMFWCRLDAQAQPQQDCQSIFDKAPRNVSEVRDRTVALLKYGHTICSSSWQYLSDVQNSKTDLSLSVLDYIGLTSNDTSSSQRFSEWKRTNCEGTNLKKDIFNDLISKQSAVSELVYKAYETCVAQRSKTTNAETCAYVPTVSPNDGYLFVYFAPNDSKTETTLVSPITLTNGKWENENRTLPKETKIRLRENFFPIKRDDITKGDFSA